MGRVAGESGRFLIAVLAAVREAVGRGFPIGAKLNSSDFQKGDHGQIRIEYFFQLQTLIWTVKVSEDAYLQHAHCLPAGNIVGAQRLRPVAEPPRVCRRHPLLRGWRSGKPGAVQLTVRFTA